MNLGLPRINGLDVTVKLKQDPRTAHVPVIAHSAWSEEKYRAAAQRAGMVGYLPKPTCPSFLTKWWRLEFLAYDVMVAKNGLEAVENASSQLPALIVMDISLPIMDGLQAASRIRINPETHGYSHTGSQRESLAGGQGEMFGERMS